MALFIAGALLETLTACVDSIQNFMCGPGHPNLTIVGMASICLPLTSVPTDPFRTEHLAGFVVQVSSKMDGLPEDLAAQSRNIDDVWSIIRVHRQLLFLTHGEWMAQLAESIHDDLETAWKEAVMFKGHADSEMSNLALNMQQTATLVDEAVQKIHKRGQISTVTSQLFSSAFPFFRSWTKNHLVVSTFLDQIDDALPRLT